MFQNEVKCIRITTHMFRSEDSPRFEDDTEDRLIFTAHKQSLGQGNVFTPVCESVHAMQWGRHLLGRNPQGRHLLGRHPLGRHL